MQAIHQPRLDARYWAAICVASVAGANLGDFLAHVAHLGHRGGLAPLALALGLVLLVERRSRRPSEIYYWVAIVLLRTAATNLADLATHEMRLGYGRSGLWLSAGFAVLVIAGWRQRRRANEAALPRTGILYWTTMLVAGVLGTVLGDTCSHAVAGGPPVAAALLAVPLLAALALRAWPSAWTRSRPLYWLAVLSVRTDATSAGDASADAVGLTQSTLLSLLLLCLVLCFGKLASRGLQPAVGSGRSPGLNQG